MNRQPDVYAPLASNHMYQMFCQFRGGRNELLVVEGRQIVAFSSTTSVKDYELDLREFCDDFFPGLDPRDVG